MAGEKEFQESLGELPDDVSDERGDLELYLKNTPAGRDDALGDLAYQERQRQQKQMPGTIPVDAGVTSIYDSRPVNSEDFLDTDYPQFANPDLATSVTATFTVPGGKVAVLRGFRYEMVPVVPIDEDDLLVSINVDGIAVANYQSMILGQVISDFIPCWVMAGDAQNINIVISAPTGLNSLNADIRKIKVHMYGQLLQASGNPTYLEASNQVVGNVQQWD